MAEKIATIPERSQVPKEDQWNLDSLFPSPQAWEEELVELKEKTLHVPRFQGRLSESAEVLKECLECRASLFLLAETLEAYASLKYSEDRGNSEAVGRLDQYNSAFSDLEVAWTFLKDELLAIDPATMEKFLGNPALKDHKIFLGRLLRFRPHTLSDKEETILAKQVKLLQTPDQAFSMLTDVDMDFGTVKTSEGTLPLTGTTLFSQFLRNKDRAVRKQAYQQFYGVYEAHKNTLAALYSGSVQQDVFLAKARNFKSARAAALFPDNVDEVVYDNLTATVTEFLPTTLHRYLGLRKARLGYEKLFLYDLRIPLVDIPKRSYPYEEAAQEIALALAPLGPEYVSTMREGLLSKGWVDRYANKGKCSGGFSKRIYQGEPYILLNYEENDFLWVSVLAHEAGHAMHSWYSVRHNPFQNYHYSYFEAEVAATLNEELLFAHLLNKSTDPAFRAYLIAERIDGLLNPLFGATRNAEYELTAHRLLEEGRPLTVEVLREEYRKLLEKYEGGVVELSEGDGFRWCCTPHFYNSFYLYLYATGVSAAIALAKGLLQDDNRSARENYLSFLKSGGSRFPIDALKVAGVDLSGPQPIREALSHVSELITTLEALLKEC